MAKKIEGITLYTTSECNLDCIYCYARDLREYNSCFTMPEWEGIISQARTMGAKWVIFAGPGEPLLDDMNFKLIKYANALGMKSILFTNGTLITEPIAEDLFSASVDITVKMPSFNPQIYNLLSGSQNSLRWVDYEFKYKDTELKYPIPLYLYILLKKYKGASRRKKCSLRIESVITKYNLRCLVDIAKFIQAHGLGFLFETLIFNNSRDFDRLIPGEKDYLFLFRELKKCLGWRFIVGQNQYKCRIRRNPVILQNGDIMLCLVEEGKIGNIRQNNLGELWQRRLSIKDESLKYKRFCGFRNCLGRQSCNKR
ncbi:MAG: radical SAM protein [Candidatus Omnitrophica bacterium]|nr:radical SAM protein [Candidatus Omnitrophota bacterium]MDD5518173.1 radical SAM protein [Candidatus Omnitrophota bacterium]